MSGSETTFAPDGAAPEHAGDRAKFAAFTEGTQEDWAIIARDHRQFASGPANRVLARLRLLDGDYGGFPIDRQQHGPQTTTHAHRGAFQGCYCFHFLGMDRGAREKFRGHPHFDACHEFCEKYDPAAFDPAYETLPHDFFEPMVRRVMAKPLRSASA